VAFTYTKEHIVSEAELTCRQLRVAADNIRLNKKNPSTYTDVEVNNLTSIVNICDTNNSLRSTFVVTEPLHLRRQVLEACKIIY